MDFGKILMKGFEKLINNNKPKKHLCNLQFKATILLQMANFIPRR